MRTDSRQPIRIAMAAGLFICVNLFVAVQVQADEAPRCFKASPDVYKVIAGNDKTRVIMATWAPGQRDQWHSHPPTGVYWLTACQARVYSPDGTFRDSTVTAGQALVQAPIPSHSFENRSTAECKAIIVENE